MACDSILLPFYIWPPNVMILVPPLADQQFCCNSLSELVKTTTTKRLLQNSSSTCEPLSTSSKNYSKQKKVMKQKQNILKLVYFKERYNLIVSQSNLNRCHNHQTFPKLYDFLYVSSIQQHILLSTTSIITTTFPNFTHKFHPCYLRPLPFLSKSFDRDSNTLLVKPP